MAKKSLLYIVVTAIMVSVSVGCTDEFKEAVRDLFGWSRTLKHDIDNQDLRAADYMRANLKFTENENVTNIPSSPAMEARMSLAKDEISIAKEQLIDVISLSADSIKYDGKTWSGSSVSTTDNTTLRWYLAGGQVVTIPVNITALRTQYKGKFYNYGTDSLIASALSVRYVPTGSATRAVGVSDTYDAVYEATLTFKEVNDNDSVFTVKLRANAVAKIADTPSDSSFIEKEHWVYVNDTTYTWDFDIIKIIAGDTITLHKSIPANYWIKGIAPYEKIVSTFNYAFNKSNGWNKGSGEREVTSAIDYVTIYQKSADHYGATILNSDDNDKITTDYTAVLQRVVYDDGDVRSEATYPSVTAKEANTLVKALSSSSKEGYNAALLTNSVDFTLLEHTRKVSENVYLYVKKPESILRYEIRNARLTVSDSKVEGRLKFVEIWSDGTENSVDDYISVNRSLVPKSDWSANSDYVNILTGAAVVNLSSADEEENGYWHYVNQTRTITTPVTLSSSTQTNSWTSVDPNSFVYEREGETYKFEEIKYTAAENNSAIGRVISETSSESVYSYTGGIKVTYGNNTKTSTAPGKVTVKKNISYSIKNAKLTINDNNVVAELDFVTTTDGNDKIEHFAKSFPKSLVCTTNWNSKEPSLSVLTGSANTSLTSSEKLSDGDWTYVRENRTITTIATLANSAQTNSWTSVVPNKIVFAKNGISHDFGTIAFTATEAGQSYTMASSNANVSTYNYTDKLNATYGNNTVSGTAPGKITIEYSVSSHEIRDQKLEVGETGVTTTLTWVTKYSNGYETTESINHFFALSIEKLTNWASKENNSSSSTGAATISLESSNNEKDGYWSNVREIRKVNTVATLAGSTQNNTLRASVPNRITFSRDGQTYAFDVLNFTANEAGQNVSKTSESDEATVYGYSDRVNINFGGRNFANTLNGTITVEKNWEPDIPKAYGKFKNAIATATQSENLNSWYYVLSIHFENGTMPIKISRGATSINLDEAKSLFTTNTNEAINSLVWTGSKWVNSIAVNEAKCMKWKNESGAKVSVLDYVSATAMAWNDGHNTIYSDAVTYSVSNNILYVNKGGSVIGKIKLNK